MPEASYQFLTLNREFDQPLVGELREGEITVNIVDGRIWIADQFSFPVELGGNAQERPIALGGRANYISIEVDSPGVFPIEIPDPQEISVGTYREIYLHLYYPDSYENPDQEPVSYVTYPVEWSAEDQEPGGDSPFLALRGASKHIIFKFFAFGPRQFWFGKVIWVSN